MSGGKEQHKIRGNKAAQGWEEAGSEFYQETFPTDLDGAIQRDPAAIATLLPSKQNRAGERFYLILMYSHTCFEHLRLLSNAIFYSENEEKEEEEKSYFTIKRM